MDKPTMIYFLRCPRSGEVRYIGKANDAARRLRDHIKAARAGDNYWCSRWIRGLLSEGKKPEVGVLFNIPLGMSWQTAERFFIAAARYIGLPITNSTPGGEGVYFLTEEQRLRAVAARRAGYTDESRAKNSAFHKEYTSRPEVREAMSLRMKKQYEDSDFRSLNRDNNKRTSRRADVREKLSQSHKILWSRPEWRAAQMRRMSDGKTSPEVESRRRASIKAAHARPEVKEKHSAAIRFTYAARHFISPIYKADPAMAVDLVNMIVAGLREDAHAGN